MRKILVLRGGALGDFIVTLPALAALRTAWPAARIELAGNATAAIIARGAGLLDAVHSQHEARWAALVASGPLPGEFAGWLGTFDGVINFWPDADGAIARRFPVRSGQQFISGGAHPATAPAAAHFCAALAPLGIPTGSVFFRLSPPVAAKAPAHGPIAIHPGSGSAAKNWPLDRWAGLCAWLQQACPALLLVITGEAEPAAARELARFGTAASDLPLDSLAARLAGCRFFLGHDSGVSHLAAAHGVPGVLLFGPTDPAVWAPPAPDVTIVRKGPEMAMITLADVQKEVSHRLSSV